MNAYTNEDQFTTVTLGHVSTEYKILTNANLLPENVTIYPLLLGE